MNPTASPTNAHNATLAAAAQLASRVTRPIRTGATLLTTSPATVRQPNSRNEHPMRTNRLCASFNRPWPAFARAATKSRMTMTRQIAQSNVSTNAALAGRRTAPAGADIRPDRPTSRNAELNTVTANPPHARAFSPAAGSRPWALPNGFPSAGRSEASTKAIRTSWKTK